VTLPTLCSQQHLVKQWITLLSMVPTLTTRHQAQLKQPLQNKEARTIWQHLQSKRLKLVTVFIL